jgi:glutamyl-tRNA reductase
MQIVVVGLDHHSSSIEVRERLAFPPSRMGDAYHQLMRDQGSVLHEAVILSTCNRVEVYAVAESMTSAQRAVSDFLHSFHGLSSGLLDEHFYAHSGKDAVAHLFATACGLNSLVLGEDQIQSQIRGAAADAMAYEADGAMLGALLRQALAVGKRVRTETNIGRYAASISHTGVQLVRQLLGGLGSTHVVLVGSGEVSELAAKNLIDNGARSITLVNRTLESAEQLARRWKHEAKWSVLPFDALTDALRDADVVLSSTAAPHTVIHADHVRTALADRPQRPLLLIDLAVPRDVDAEVAQIEGAHVYDIDDLTAVVQTNLERRREELGAAQLIVDQETERFMGWVSSRTVVPTLASLRAQADSISQSELAKAMRRFGTLDDREREVMESLASGIVNKLLHQPTVRLKQEAANGDATSYAEALRFLFGLDTNAHGA